MTDTYKVLGQIESTAGSVVPLYVVPAGKQAVSSALSIVNTGGSAANYSLFAVPGYEYGSILVETEEQWLQAGQDIDAEAVGDSMGRSVSISGNGYRVAIGAPDNDGNGSRAGHVRVYDWNGTAWVQLGQDIDGEAAGDQSGWSVSMSSDGSRVAIGAPENNGNGTYSGHVRVYDWNGTAWVQLGQDIDGEAAGDFSGRSVSLSADGSRVAIGAPNNYTDGGGGGAGHVRVYDWNGTAWVQLGQDIDGETYQDNSGSSVAVSADGSRVAIGARFNNDGGDAAGHVRVYDWNGTAWVQLGQDIDGEAAGDFSGWSVSLSADGSRVAIGAPNNDGDSNFIDKGHVRVYDWNGTAWVQLGQDIDGEANFERLGSSVALSADGSRLVSGTEVDKAKVYNFNFSGTEIAPQNKHTLIKSKSIDAGEHHTISGGVTLPSETQIMFSSDTDSLVTSIFGVEIS
jgi:hypothetical protein